MAPEDFGKTFWKWLEEQHEKGYDHPHVHVIMWIKQCLVTSDILPTEPVQTYDDLSAILIRQRFDRDELRQAQALWDEYVKAVSDLRAGE